MPHKIDTEHLTQNSFILRHLALGNRDVSLELQFTREADREASYGWGDVALRLEELVSSLLIDTAIKFRIIMDFITKLYADSPDVGRFEDRFKGADSTGCFIPTMDDLNIREACNKIVHAHGVDLEWHKIEHTEYECWTGSVLLSGMKGKKEWQCRIVVTQFCRVLEMYLQELDQTRDYVYSWLE